MTDIPETTHGQPLSSAPRRLPQRLLKACFESGEDIAALRRFVRLMEEEFARVLGITVPTRRDWQQGCRKPEGPALAVLPIAAHHSRIIREDPESAVKADAHAAEIDLSLHPACIDGSAERRAADSRPGEVAERSKAAVSRVVSGWGDLIE